MMVISGTGHNYRSWVRLVGQVGRSGIGQVGQAQVGQDGG